MRRRGDRGAGGGPRPDPYQLLGLGPDASVAEINAAYRQALLRQHPDTRTPRNASPSDPTMADLQAARAELLRLARAARDRPPPPPAPEPRDAEARRKAEAADRSGTRVGRGWAVRLDGIDLVVGPVRYHGPTPRRSR
jgi:curved DNA-binding protein CbpA